LLQIGDRVIDLSAVVAAEKGEGRVTVYLTGVLDPFRFTGEEAGTVWAALLAAVAPAGVAVDAPAEFQVIEMSLDASEAPDEGPDVAGPIYKNIDLSERMPDSQMIA
jgi:hypothetical protein